MILSVIGAILGMAGLVFLSPIAIKYASKLGEIFGLSPLLIGIFIISWGTNMPEITNSIISSVIGQSQIGIGNLIGSSIMILTLVTAVIILFMGPIEVDRKNVAVLGISAIIGILMAYSIIEKGSISRLNGGILVFIYFALLYFLNSKVDKKEYVQEAENIVIFSQKFKYVLILLFLIVGIFLSSAIFLDSIINISEYFLIPSFIIGLFLVSIGTNLPDLFLGLNALKKGEAGIVIGNSFGSVITNMNLGIGLGALFVPTAIDLSSVIPALNYLLILWAMVFLIFVLNKKLDRKIALLLLLLYAAQFLIIK